MFVVTGVVRQQQKGHGRFYGDNYEDDYEEGKT
jgi:hypothetical protein